MANLYEIPADKHCVTVLDAGAGSGILSCAFIEWLERFDTIREIELTCYENNRNVLRLLKDNLEYCKKHSTKAVNTERCARGNSYAGSLLWCAEYVFHLCCYGAF